MKRINKKIPFLLVLFIVLSANSQQTFQFSHYRQNMNTITPAVAGMNDRLEFLISSRTKWAGVGGGPQTYNFNVNSPVEKNLGLGLTIVGDKVNISKQIHTYADVSYRLKVSNDIDIYGGMKLGGTFVSIDFNKLKSNVDPLLNNNVSQFNFNFGFGFYLKAPKYYMSLSMPRILSKGLHNHEDKSTAISQLPLFLSGGYDFDLNSDFIFKSSVLSSIAKGSPVSTNITGSFLYKNQYELGMNYRINESISFFTMFYILKNKLNLGYAYEHSTNDIQQVSNGTHEVVLKFNL